MKKIMFVVVLALVVSSCAAPEQGENNANGVATNTNIATPVSSPAPVSATPDVAAKERQVWDAIKGKDYDGLANLLADDMVYISGDGAYDKASTVNGLKGLAATEVTLTNFKTVTIDKDAAVVIYDVEMKGTMDGKPIRSAPLHASSAWLNRDGKWLAVYHQDTEPVATPTRTPASNSNAPLNAATPGATAATPAASASPSSATAAMTATDMEKQAWDAIKRKDYDAFANFLASDALDVEPEGVYTKAETLNEMKNMPGGGDMSNLVLSDFKEMKFDADATLVTYMTKGPRQIVGGGMREATIWVNRDGRWQAIFHQGTAITQPRK